MGERDEELQKSERLDKLKQRLYSPKEKFGVRERRELHQKNYQLEDDWEHKNNPFEEKDAVRRISPFAKLLIAAALFFIGTLFYAGIVMIDAGPKTGTGDIDIAVIGPVSIGAGETLTYDIVIQNNDAVPIETVDLVVIYPEGSKQSDDLSQSLPRLRDGIGELDPGDVIKRTKTVALFGNENDNKEIEVGIEYRIPGISTIFKKKKIFDITLQSSPIRIALDAVNEHVVGQTLDMELTVSSNSTKTLENIMVSVDYPFGFVINEETDQPNYGDNVWLIGTLEPKQERTITISGDLQGQNDEERVFNFYAGLQDPQAQNKLGTTFTSLLHTIAIERPFFAIDIEFDGEKGDSVVRRGEQRIQAVVEYTNNLNDPIYDGEVVLQLSGEVLDKSSVQVANGFYDSNTNTITWNKSTSNIFDELAPRVTKNTRFSFNSKDLGSTDALFQNPEILIDAKLSGKRVSEDDVQEDITTEVFRKVRFATRSALEATTFYGVGPFENEGPVPPKVETPTEYTIQWEVYNTSNDIDNARVVGTLPTYVEWKGIYTPESENVTYDPNTRVVTWNLGTLSAGTGYSDAQETLEFQVVFTPSVSQIGRTPDLVSNQQVIGADSFAGTQISTALKAVNIAAEDLRLSIEAGRVTD